MSDTPSISEVLRVAIEDQLARMYTAMPGIVVSYDSAKQTVDVQPTLRKQYSVTGKNVTLPVVNRVPVAWYRAGGAFISFPIKAGDYVLLIFQKSPIDLWLKKGGVVDPTDFRKFHLTDAVAYPGVYPWTQLQEVPTDRMRIQNKKARIDLTEDGKVRFENTEGDELLGIMKDFCDVMKAALVLTGIGPEPFLSSTQVQIEAIKTRLAALQAGEE